MPCISATAWLTQVFMVLVLGTYGWLHYMLSAIENNDAECHPSFHSSRCSYVEYSVAFPYYKGFSTSCEMDTGSCGMCGQNEWVRYLTELSNDLHQRFADRCRELVVFSVALGPEHEEYVAGNIWHNDTTDLLLRHGTQKTEV